MPDKIKVMVAGHLCLDITPKFNSSLKENFADIFAPGKLINVEDAVMGTGGAVSNTGLAMAKLGVDVKLNGKVGNDEFGSIIRDIVGNERASSFKIVTDQSSSYSIVLALPGVDRIFLHHPGTNDTFVADDIDYDTLANCSLLHLGYPTLMRKMFENEGQQLFKIFEKAKQLGVITSLDMSLPDPNSESGRADWQKILKKVLPFVDIFLPSVEEIAYMLDRDLFEKRKAQSAGSDPVLSYTGSDMSKLSNELMDLGVKIVAIKAGINGYYLKTADNSVLKDLSVISDKLDVWAGREIWAGSYKAEKVASATGAGDATIAGFLTAFLNGLSPVQCVKTANILGWQNVREFDTLTGIEDWQTTMDMISNDNIPLNQHTVKDNGWRYCDVDKIYYGPNDKCK